jgi:hypothetical protein
MINRSSILVQPEPLGRNIDNEIQIASLSADYDESAAITSISVTATQIDLKDGDNINIAGQSLVVNADAAAGATSLTIDSITLTSPIVTGEQIRINEENLFVQYQRKTEGTIAGMPVDGRQLGPIDYTGGVYSIIGVDPTYMKILPRDFMVNDDVGSATDTPPLVFQDGNDTGIHVEDTSQELIATVNIPYGTTATEVTIWASNTTKVVEVYEMTISANGKGSDIGTGTTNGSAIDITDTAATTTNYLMIIVKVSSTNHRVWGGTVTLTQ